eukprot:Clim_evm33s155 gene=Clim_evmTU33s155
MTLYNMEQNGGATTPATAPTAADVEVYLVGCLPYMLGCPKDAVSELLGRDESKRRLQSFATDPTTGALAVGYDNKSNLFLSDDISGAIVGKSKRAGQISNDLLVVLVRRNTSGLLANMGGVAPQVDVMTFAGGRPLNSLQATLHRAIAPLFTAYIDGHPAVSGALEDETRGKDSGDASDENTRKSLMALRKRLAELDLLLSHMQDEVSVPHVTLKPSATLLSRFAGLAGIEFDASAVKTNIATRLDDSDDALIELLARQVSDWAQEIRTLVSHDRDPATSTAIQEIQLWTTMETALQSVKDRISSPNSAVGAMLNLLADSGNFKGRMTSTNFQEEIRRLDETLGKVKDYAAVMRDFPIQNLLAADTMDTLREAEEACFGHLESRMRGSSYPSDRCVLFTRNLTRDVVERAQHILRRSNVLAITSEKGAVNDSSSEALVGFLSLMKNVRTQLLALSKVLKESGTVDKGAAMRLGTLPTVNNMLCQEAEVLRQRVTSITQFKDRHQQLQRVLEHLNTDEVGGNDENSALAANLKEENHGKDKGQEVGAVLSDAFADVARVAQEFDLTESGSESWANALARYDEQVGLVEAELIVILQRLLNSAVSSQDMFETFNRFSMLFDRPRIRQSVRRYQTMLVERTQQDLQRLQQRFQRQYATSDAARTSEMRDIPGIAGAIIWANQLRNRVELYKRRMRMVLGEGWENHIEGKAIYEQADLLLSRLDPQAFFDDWLKAAKQKDLSLRGPVYSLMEHRRRKGASTETSYSLGINVDRERVNVYQEYKYLVPLGFTISFVVVQAAEKMKLILPQATIMKESLHAYSSTAAQLDALDMGPNSKSPDLFRLDLRRLLLTEQKSVRSVISDGMSLKWENNLKTVTEHSRRLSAAIISYRTFADDLMRIGQNVRAQLEILRSASFTEGPTVMKDCLRVLQEDVVNFLALRITGHGSQNMKVWTHRLDMAIEKILAHHVVSLLNWWGAAIREEQTSQEGDSGEVKITGGEQFLDPLRVSLRIKGNQISCEPPAGQVRSHGYELLNDAVTSIVSLPRLTYRDARFGQDMNVKSTDYVSLLESDLSLDALPQTPQTPNDEIEPEIQKPRSVKKAMALCVSIIERQSQKVEAYIKQWFNYQSLWIVDMDAVESHVLGDIRKWYRLVKDMVSVKQSMGSSQTLQSFGPLSVVDYGALLSKMTEQYAHWQTDLVHRFADRLQEAMASLREDINGTRTQLERLKFLGQTGDTASAIEMVNLVRQCRHNQTRNMDLIEVFGKGEKFLMSRALQSETKFTLASNWLYADNLLSEWQTYQSILQRRENAIQDGMAELKERILEEDKRLSESSTIIVREWAAGRPLSGFQFKSDQALSAILVFESKLAKVHKEEQHLLQAKESLDLATFSAESKTTVIDAAMDELRNLQNVWEHLNVVDAEYDDYGEQQWSAVIPRKTKEILDRLIEKLRGMPPEVLQYAAWEHRLQQYNDRLKMCPTLFSLKSDAFKERHWRQLLRSINSKASISELTMAGVLDIVANAQHEELVKNLISTAQGEMALEQYLIDVREFWFNYELTLVGYKQRTKLISGWDELFEKANEHISALQSMKHSPYFKIFEEEAKTWIDKLEKVVVVFDSWIDVQRMWVYLDGIFGAVSSEIRSLLPSESNKFSNISSEYLQLMKQVTRKARVLDIVAIDNLHATLTRLLDLIHKIQKALGNYLERERSRCSRFYFVGDEDLLEIVGNGSSDITKIQRHFRKMYAGIHSLTYDANARAILGMESREGEKVAFSDPIALDRHPAIHQWLGKVEEQMCQTLASLLGKAVTTLNDVVSNANEELEQWLESYPAQVINIAFQVRWTDLVEAALEAGGGARLEQTLADIDDMLDWFAKAVLSDQATILRKKMEQIITELVHERQVIRHLINCQVTDAQDFEWLCQMRFYWDPSASGVTESLIIRIADASFKYGFEYLGVAEKLVQTPLTDRCYLTLTQALHAKLGGSPFGPAGTGKTESVKALGAQFGKFVVVFNCDETFDFGSMGRILTGLCRVGAWGCFDEFNRLEERILSAVSQQIQNIQLGLQSGSLKADLMGKDLALNEQVAIFVTMNPGYAGRSHLPDNLKKLFRSIAMTVPDVRLISEVMLFSLGFQSAEALARKVVPFFQMCKEQLSAQPHYDFGLRALKSVLGTAGALKRQVVDSGQHQDKEPALYERKILMQSVVETVMPKAVPQDRPLLESLVEDVFPDVELMSQEAEDLDKALATYCSEHGLQYTNNWRDKVLQVYRIQSISHGIMLVGPSGSGKSTALRGLAKTMFDIDGVDTVLHTIDPKAITKADLYGFMDNTTREWTDGIFTSILRRILDNVRGELNKRQWIIFDGDVDPEWVENLNSVLDDNKLLTLPNGERIGIPPNVRIIFETQDLKYATLATVSRCGMIWFSEDVVSLSMLFQRYLSSVLSVDFLDSDGTLSTAVLRNVQETAARFLGPRLGLSASKVEKLIERSAHEDHDSLEATEIHALECDTPVPEETGLLQIVLDTAECLNHIMSYTPQRAINSLCALLSRGIHKIHAYNVSHPDFPLEENQTEDFLNKWLLHSLVWAFAGDCPFKDRQVLSDALAKSTTAELPPMMSGSEDSDGTEATMLIDYDVAVTGEWVPWRASIAQIEIETHRVGAPDVVVPTVDTVRHEALLMTWLEERHPMVLCGPPGSGKTMSLLNSLRCIPNVDVTTLNFSSSTSPELILKNLVQHCRTTRTPSGTVMSPRNPGRWLVLFCDEINLPATDEYGTQRALTFLRQMIELGGFWLPTGGLRGVGKAGGSGDGDIQKDVGGSGSGPQFIKLDRVQFIGACNPPTDPGRKPLPERFLRHVPVIFVDYPQKTSLQQIYGTFNRAIMRLQPSLRGYAMPLTDAQIDLYTRCQRKYTQDMQAHYVYSPREMTRWCKGIYMTLKDTEYLTLEDLVRIWAHEALRLFQDRLVDEKERLALSEMIQGIVLHHFPNVDGEQALKPPILYSDWLSRQYSSVDREELRDYVKARLRTFYEEELDVPLVLFDDVFDQVLRIDRVLKQKQGHALLIGLSGSGKTTLTRFTAWLDGLNTVSLKVHGRYRAQDFDDDLRNVLRRCAVQGERICLIIDEGNILDSSFLERINTLLANGEIPGLFDGDEYQQLISQMRDAARRQDMSADTEEECYAFFMDRIMTNLHVVFTMNPPTGEGGLRDRASASPALFNRCVVDWFGDWSQQALNQVAYEFTMKLDLDRRDYSPPTSFNFHVHDSTWKRPSGDEDASNGFDFRTVVVNTLVYMHHSMVGIMRRLQRQRGTSTVITPRHYLDMVNHFNHLFQMKRSDLEDQQRHLNTGLRKLQQTLEQVTVMQESLAVKRHELQQKQHEANEKLQQMLGDQQAAERQRDEAVRVSAIVEEKSRIANERRAQVTEELAGVEPAVQDAKEAVQGIKKTQLNEIRALTNPPPMVKLALESVVTLLGEKQKDWKSIRSAIARENFTSSILNFDTDRVTEDLRKQMMKEFLDNPDYSYEKINKASRACGPLAKWVIAQVEYSEMLLKVGPLRKELKAADEEVAESDEKLKALQAKLEELETSIAAYKEEYAVLISQAESLKQELNTVETKVQRSLQILESLQSEQERWTTESSSFDAAMSTIAGDALLAAGFATYGGYLDQHYREGIVQMWRLHFLNAGIPMSDTFSFAGMLSTADQQLYWHQECGLPNDALCRENAVLLLQQRAGGLGYTVAGNTSSGGHSATARYPLIIDPSDQALRFLENYYNQSGSASPSRGGVASGQPQQRLIKTSFLDASFRKNLESALRFGNALLVQDAEYYDPILNPVLNREVRRALGRVFMPVADGEVDFSPSFQLYLSTRDPTAKFGPDLCSRVTFVNFTVTPSSLQNQCLDRVLQAERPDLEQKRRDQMRLQGEFQVRLRRLEKQLLDALSESDTASSILDDDAVLSHLETLKSEAQEVGHRMTESSVTMREIDRVSNGYTPLASVAANLYFALDRMAQVHYLYHFSLDAFLEVYDNVVVANSALDGVKGHDQRLRIMEKTLPQAVVKNFTPAMKQHDRTAFALQLCGLVLENMNRKLTAYSGRERDSEDEQEDYMALVQAGLDTLMRCVNHGGATALLRGQRDAIDDVSETIGTITRVLEEMVQTAQTQGLASVFTSETIEHVQANAVSWRSFYATFVAEDEVPRCWREPAPPAITANLSAGDLTGLRDELHAHTQQLFGLVVVQSVRPDRFLTATQRFIDTVLGSGTTEMLDSEPDLADLRSGTVSPVVLACAPGYDASNKLIDAAAKLGKKCLSIALGSSEATTAADQAIAQAARSGHWVLLRNVHLAPQWLQSYAKRLQTIQAKDGFRVILTAEISPKLPPKLLRQSRLFTFEAPPGLRSQLLHCLATVDASAMDANPRERARLYFMVCWLHVNVLERLRYAPLGWSQMYEFGDADLAMALKTVDEWLSLTTGGAGTNLSPDRIPWQALRALLRESVYGGRLDNEFDQQVLNGLLEDLFHPGCYRLDFVLASGGPEGRDLTTPEGKTHAEFLAWARGLPSRNSPAWLGLPAHAETRLRIEDGGAILRKVQFLTSLADDETAPFGDEDEEEIAVTAAADGADDADAEAYHLDAAHAKQERFYVPARFRILRGDVQIWRAVITEAQGPTEPLSRSPARIADPIFRSLDREVSQAVALQSTVLNDLEVLDRALNARAKLDNRLREYCVLLSAGRVPAAWTAPYRIPADLSPRAWAQNLAARLQQHRAIADTATVLPEGGRIGAIGTHFAQNLPLDLGLLFVPEGYVSAMQQHATRANGWSLEDVAVSGLVSEAVDGAELDACQAVNCNFAFIVNGLTLEGATWDNARGGVADSVSLQNELPPVTLHWTVGAVGESHTKRVSFPMYLDSHRKHLICTLPLMLDTQHLPLAKVRSRGVAIIASRDHV